MLDYADLGSDFWVFAMVVAVHLHNRTFRRDVNDISLRLLTGATLISPTRAPSAARPLCMSLMPDPCACPSFATRPKTATSAREGIFVGYSSDSHAWFVWMPDTRVVLASRSVAFHEGNRLSRFDPSLHDE
jgi:hypothetical protein